ncbi:hypothetical protein [Methanimicrococcus hongohii]|uniref:hypothetical protein n=1 Tax=Methanimicrococcus hongohii TaxID=3028295 RepID=UPI002930FB38|nr:hypothetical protein [Methanimicrococcus sp. Hf6]
MSEIFESCCNQVSVSVWGQVFGFRLESGFCFRVGSGFRFPRGVRFALPLPLSAAAAAARRRASRSIFAQFLKPDRRFYQIKRNRNKRNRKHKRYN